MSVEIKKECPNCGKMIPIPVRVIIFAPLWPFGHWRCANCSQELGLVLGSYYLIAFIGLIFVGGTSALFGMLGFTSGSVINALAMLLVAVIMMIWLPARLARIRVLYS